MKKNKTLPHFFFRSSKRELENKRSKKGKNMASSAAEQPQEQQRAPGLPRAEFIEDVGKFLEGRWQ